MFKTVVHGKWILAGEHAVLRGSPALVFPLCSRSLSLKYADGSETKQKDLTLKLTGDHGGELEVLFWGVIEKACEIKKINRAQLLGHVEINSSIPVGAGLGASAALSVAITKWMTFLKYVNQDEQLDFARKLENLFHGESSGVDIAVAISGKGLKYKRALKDSPVMMETFDPQWQPKWYVSYSGKRGVTLECVKKVKSFIQNNETLGSKIDQQMADSVTMAESALLMNEKEGLPRLKNAIDKANDCFNHWGLVEGLPQVHMNWLLDSGAIATKPTGSGDGGYVLSLWDKNPPEEVLKKLIPCF